MSTILALKSNDDAIGVGCGIQRLFGNYIKISAASGQSHLVLEGCEDARDQKEIVTILKNSGWLVFLGSEELETIFAYHREASPVDTALNLLRRINHSVEVKSNDGQWYLVLNLTRCPADIRKQIHQELLEADWIVWGAKAV